MNEQTPPPGAPGGHESRIARGALSQQASQAVGVVTMLVVVTILGRRLSLAEFGVYGLLISLAAYLLLVQLSVEAATVRAIAGAPGAAARSRVFSTALLLYVCLGIASGAIIAAGGLALVGLLSIPDSLRREALEAVLILGAVTAIGWPFKVFQDSLRGAQLFSTAAAAEVAAHLCFVAGMTVSILLDAPLSALIGLGGALPALIGIASAAAAGVVRLPFGFRRGVVSLASARELGGVAAYLFVGTLTDIVIYQIDRLVLAAFRPAATVGLYEAAARPHNLIRQLHGTLVLTVMPAASGFVADADDVRLRELLIRGTRYVLAVVVPVTVVLLILSGPILEAWLGEPFRAAAPATAIFLAYWLVGANTGVSGAMLVAVGELRSLTIYAWMVALTNLILSLLLTPTLGLNGVVLATTVSYLLFFPYFMRLVLRAFPVSLGELWREAWLPAYSIAVALAVALAVARAYWPLDTLFGVLAAAGGGLLAAWASYYVVWLRPNERLLVRSLLRRSAPAG